MPDHTDAEKLSLLRRCRTALDVLLRKKPILGAMFTGIDTLGNLRAELYPYRIEAEGGDDTHSVIPIPMVLHCPRCGTQHIDAPETDNEYERRIASPNETSETQGDNIEPRWTNPPHKSHLCHNVQCVDEQGRRTVWRPSALHTTGVAALPALGERDTWPRRESHASASADRTLAQSILAAALNGRDSAFSTLTRQWTYDGFDRCDSPLSEAVYQVRIAWRHDGSEAARARCQQSIEGLSAILNTSSDSQHAHG